MTAAAVVDDDRLDAMYAALGDRTRRGIVARLAQGDATVNELAAPFAMSLQAVSQHIGVLERAGLVTRTRVRQTRPCHLDADALAAATGWIEEQRAAWNDRLDRLERHLADVQHTPSPTRKKKKK